MLDQALTDYITQTSQAGFDKDEIREALFRAGWSTEEIEEGFAAIKTDKPPRPPGFFSRHQKAVVIVLALLVLLPLLAYGGKWGYEKLTTRGGPALPAPSPATQGNVAERDQKRLQNIASVQTSLATYYTNHQAYPKDLATLMSTAPRDPKTGEIYLYTALGDPAVHYSLSFILEGTVSSLPSGLQTVSDEIRISAKDLQNQESAIKGEASSEPLKTLEITNIDKMPFYPQEEVTLSVAPVPGADLVNAFILIDNLKLVDRSAPFSFSFSAPRTAGEYLVQVYAFDRNGDGYTQTTNLIVK